MATVMTLRDAVRVSGRRALRVALAFAVLVATALLVDSALASGRSETTLQALNRQVLAGVNRFRAKHGRAPLHESTALDTSARRHSLEMGRLGYFGHSSADGMQFWQRIRHFYPAHGYSYWSVGENLVWRSPSLDAAEALKLWIASPPHLKNLLSRQWRQVGVSAVSVAHGSGVYRGAHAIIVTTDFGVRR